jgi:hypothetical protein
VATFIVVAAFIIVATIIIVAAFIIRDIDILEGSSIGSEPSSLGSELA